jgi:uncharacterized membrane protein
MRSAAFTIYVLNLAGVIFPFIESGFSANLYHYLNNIISIIMFFIFIVMCIAAFILKKVCEDEYLKKHFEYQFKTMLKFFLFCIILAVINILVVYTAFMHNITTTLFDIFFSCVVLGLIIAPFIIGIWFFYKNAKGLIYLFTGRYL